MKTINTQQQLREAILLLEANRTEKEKLLKKQFTQAYESIKPINLLKSTFKQVTQSGEIKNGILNTALSAGAGYFAKLLFQTLAKSPLTKIAGFILQFGVSNAAMKNPEIMQAVEENVLKLFTSNKEEKNLHQPTALDLKG